MDIERFDTIVVGAGQAGPGLAYTLAGAGSTLPSSSATRSAAPA